VATWYVTVERYLFQFLVDKRCLEDTKMQLNSADYIVRKMASLYNGHTDVSLFRQEGNIL